MDLSGRIPIKCLFISKYVKTHGDNPCQYDISILTPDEKYIEYELVVKQQILTPFVVGRVRSFFQPYRLGFDSSVCVTDTLSENDPLYLYLLCLGQQIGFDVHTASAEKILKRIRSFRPQWFKSIKKQSTNRRDLQRIWRDMLGVGACPWINAKNQEKLNSMSKVKLYKKQIVRLGAYYMLIKRYTFERDRKSNAKRGKTRGLILKTKNINVEKDKT